MPSLTIYICSRYFEEPPMCEYTQGGYESDDGIRCRVCRSHMVRVIVTPEDPGRPKEATMHDEMQGQLPSQPDWEKAHHEVGEELRHVSDALIERTAERDEARADWPSGLLSRHAPGITARELAYAMFRADHSDPNSDGVERAWIEAGGDAGSLDYRASIVLNQLRSARGRV